MTAADSSSALAGCEPGTFLVRFSNIPGMYTVCFVDDRGKLCHTRIERAVDADVATAAATAAATATTTTTIAAATVDVAKGESGGDEAEKYRFVSSKATSDTASVSELINLHSLIFRRPFTQAARQRRMRSVVRVFDVASELPIPPDVLKHVAKYASTDSPAGIRVMFNTVVSDITALPSSDSSAATGGEESADVGPSSTLRAVGGAVGGAVRAVLRRRTDASASPAMLARTASPQQGPQGWSDRWLVLCDEVLVEVDDSGVRARLPLVTTWLYMKDAREPYLDAVLPAKERRVYRPAMPATSVTAFVSRVRRRTLALLGGDGSESYEVRHVPHMFADHTYYEGSWREGVFDGVGVFISQHGRYEGEFVGGRRHGYGTYAFATGETYRGEWKADARHGAGVLQYRAQDVYERFVGTWRDDRRDGRGTLFWYAAGGGQLRSLTCLWSRGRLQLDRVAALAYDNGSLYCGEFRVVTVTTKASVTTSRESSSHLTTTASNPNAARTLGGMPHLQPSPGFSRVHGVDDGGTLGRSGSDAAADDSEVGADTAASRAKKSGERLVLQRHGFGAMYESDGSLYVGQFSADQRHGNGYFLVDGGAELVGEWREGRPRGRGTVTFAGDAGTIGGTVIGPPEVFEPPGALQFSNAVVQLLRPAPGGRRHSVLTGARWSAVLPSGSPIDAGASLFAAQSGDKHDLKQATRRAGDAWRSHAAAIGAALARASEDGSTCDDAMTSVGVRSSSSAASGEEQLVLALTQLMCTDDNVIGHAYSAFVAIFVEVRALPPRAAEPPLAVTMLRGEARDADDADALLQSQSTPALLVARRNWRGDVPLQEALSDVLGFTSAAVRRISRAFADVPALANMSQRMLDIVLRASDSVLFPKLYDLVFPLFQKRHKTEDARLAKLCESIREHPIEVQFDMFGASSRFCDAVASEPQSYAPCARAAGEMARLVAPAQKLGCLVGACRVAEELIARAGKTYGADELLPVLCYALVQSQLTDIHAQFAFVEEFVGDTVSQSYDACMFTHFTVALNFLASPRADDALAQATTAHATKREKIRLQAAATAAANAAAATATVAATADVAVVADATPPSEAPAAAALEAPKSPSIVVSSPGGGPRIARRHTKPLPVLPASDTEHVTPTKRNKPVPPLPGAATVATPTATSTPVTPSVAIVVDEPERERPQLTEHLHESRIAALQASLPELSKEEAEQVLNACNQNVELALQRASRRGRRRTTLAASDNMNAASPF
jgi:hypothetical protein